MKKLIVLCLLLGGLANPFTLAWIAGLSVVSDELEPSDAVVPLRGSPDEERVRLEEAARLVRKRFAPVLLVSVDRSPYYGQSVQKLVEAYLKQQGFPLRQLRFCANRAEFTTEEAQAIRSCLEQIGARQAIIVTSEYHTRRTRFLFRRAFADSGIAPLIHPAYHAAYWDPHWWRRKRWTRTFLLETMSLVWNVAEQFGLSLREGLHTYGQRAAPRQDKR